MAAALPPSTAPPLLTRRSAAGLLPFHRARRGQYAAARHGGCCARRLLAAAATAGATRGLTRRATAVAAAQGRAQAGEGAEEGSLQMVLLSTAVAVCGSFEFGACVGYSAPAQAGIVSDIGLSNSQYGIFASVLTVGAMVGALTSGRLADTLGRKMTMWLAAIVGIFGWLAIYLAKVPVFISEIAPKDLRGGLAASNQGFQLPTSLEQQFRGAFWLSWANIGREKEFRASLQKLRGEKADISGEATGIIEYVESVRDLPKARIQDLFHRKNMYAVIVSKCYQINCAILLTKETFCNCSSPKLQGFLIPITLLGALLMDRSGRRTLLLVSSSGTFVGCFLTGLSFYFKAQGLYTQLVPTLALYGILAYYVAYSIGMGPVPWVIMSEIFSINMKGIAGSLVTLVSWVGSFVISYSFSFLMDWNSAGTFFLFSAASLVTVLFVARLVPETKGRTLEEIQESLMAVT
ncbi:sugar transporter ERD6-like 16 [Triticum aestivum]|uniref:sugar transporter ERD6-like 16 n=1 Tax=Triticum aestivum TaxID=4565 RepID=UPI001D00B31D|nr:sugar transporter ERD6-like 16 [Triticum aestivum]